MGELWKSHVVKRLNNEVDGSICLTAPPFQWVDSDWSRVIRAFNSSRKQVRKGRQPTVVGQRKTVKAFSVGVKEEVLRLLGETKLIHEVPLEWKPEDWDRLGSVCSTAQNMVDRKMKRSVLEEKILSEETTSSESNSINIGEGSSIHLEPNSIIVGEGSSIRLESNSIIVGEGSSIHIGENNSTIHLEPNSIHAEKGSLIHIGGNNSTIRLEPNSILAEKGSSIYIGGNNSTIHLESNSIIVGEGSSIHIGGNNSSRLPERGNNFVEESYYQSFISFRIVKPINLYLR